MSDQLGLFTREQQNLATPLSSRSLPPIAAKADPPTSAKAAAEFTRSGARQRQIDRVVELVRQWPGCTSRELSRLSGVDRHLIAKRLPDARKQGLVANPLGDVVKDGKRQPLQRPCRYSGNDCVVWVPASGGVGAVRGGR